MKLNEEKIDQAVLALLYLGLHEERRAWKGIDWDAMNRLHEKGYISDPVGKAKSIVFTDKDSENQESFWRISSVDNSESHWSPDGFRELRLNG